MKDINVENLTFIPEGELKEFTQYCNNIIEELKIYGVYILDLVNKENKKMYCDTVLLFILRSYIELIDSIEILYKYSCCAPSIPILRNMFELIISVVYIFNKNTNERALAYQVDHMHNYILSLDKIQYKQKLKNNSSELKTTEYNYTEKIEKINKALSKPPYKGIEEEWRKTVKRNKYTRWYSLFNGPNSIRQLAKECGYVDLYDDIYQIWSRYTHGASALGALRIDNEDDIIIENLRLPDSLKSNVSILCSMSYKIYFEYIKYYLKEEDLKNYKQFYKNISEKLEIIKDATFKIQYI